MRRAVASRPLVVIIFTLAAMWALVGGLLQPVMPLYVASIGGQAADVGIASAMTALAMLVSEPLWGWAADRFGATVPLTLSRLASAAIFGGFMLRADLAWVFLLQFLRGVAEVALAPIGRALLAVSVPMRQRATAMGLYYTVNSLARGGTGFIGGGVVDGLGYPALFASCAGISGVSALLAALGLRRAPISLKGDVAPAAPEPSMGEQDRLLEPSFVRYFLLISLVTVLGHTATAGWRTFLPLYAATRLGMSATEIGIMFTIWGIVVTLFTLPGGRLADAFGRKPILLLGLVLITATVLLTASDRMQGTLAIAGLFVLVGLGQAAFNPARTALLSDIAPLRRQGLVIGLYGSAEDMGLLIGPLVAGFLWEGSGPAIAFAALGASGALALMVAVVAIDEPAWQRLRSAVVSPRAADIAGK
ncbi:MAG: MFS transporter [Chloroflexota bacterium]|nr:MFS transporter [Chloroflexota bacterium]MDE3193666.1 MFS transporter [Chloroflexota bacterium]